MVFLYATRALETLGDNAQRSVTLNPLACAGRDGMLRSALQAVLLYAAVLPETLGDKALSSVNPKFTLVAAAGTA